MFLLESDVILLYSSNNYLTYFQNTDNQIEIISVHCDLFIFFTLLGPDNRPKLGLKYELKVPLMVHLFLFEWECTNKCTVGEQH